MMIPNSVGLVPNYIIMAWLKWVNTWYPLIIPGLATPFAVFWMRQYMTTVPDEMIEAARIDGCGPFATYWRVVTPVVLPGMAALAIFSFMGKLERLCRPVNLPQQAGAIYLAAIPGVVEFGGLRPADSPPSPFCGLLRLGPADTAHIPARTTLLHRRSYRRQLEVA